MSIEKIKPIMILAGGFGTRLRSIIPHLPKPLAPINNKPFLIYLLQNYISQGGRDFILLLHYESELIKMVISKFFKNCNVCDLRIRFVTEKKPLGTGGAIKNAIEKYDLDKSFLVANGDTWLSSGLKEMNHTKPNSIAAVKVIDTLRYGTLSFDGNVITKFLEKSKKGISNYVNVGLYHLNPSIFYNLEHQKFLSLEDHIFPSLVSVDKLTCTILQTDFIDIGIPEDYYRFCNQMKNK